MTNKETLSTLLKKLSFLNNGTFPSEGTQLDEILEENRMAIEGFPDWLVKLFDALIYKVEVSRTAFQNNINIEQDVTLLFYELKDLMNNVDIEDEGEYTEIFFKNLDIAVALHWQDEKYEVYKV